MLGMMEGVMLLLGVVSTVFAFVVVIYCIILFRRFVIAVEKIAEKQG